MSFSLYAATIPTFCQILEAVAALLDKGAAHCAAKGIAPADLIRARLAPDMFDFAYQVKSTAVHSLGAIEGVRRGLFSPDLEPPPEDFPGLRARVTGALTGLRAIAAEEVDGFIGRDMRFEFRDLRVDFTAENFLLSFTQPNFFFHATTAYDILRWQGVAIGKRDFIGRLRGNYASGQPGAAAGSPAT
ncbi:MAG: DUF1993 domain-containing protein [Gammaproteobacteria bacterium]|nr:DUF1993 domain-containing protein [Gammaproteobacteria bacterium]